MPRLSGHRSIGGNELPRSKLRVSKELHLSQVVTPNVFIEGPVLTTPWIPANSMRE